VFAGAVLSDRNAHAAALLRRSEAARTAAEFETQCDSLRATIALKADENARLMAAFGELERKVMLHGTRKGVGIVCSLK
jgi:hypothetical protein